MDSGSELLQKGLVQYETGDRRGAALHFVSLIRQDPNAEKAWWMLAACVDTQEQKRDCLERVLEINPWNEEARAALDELELTPPDPFKLAKVAEANHDYEAAHKYFIQAIEITPTCAAAWFGRGFNAGMLSTPHTNGVREFFQCLGKGLRATGMATNNLQGLTLEHLAPRIDATQAQALAFYLRTLFDYITGLADRCSPNMSNIYSVERVHLADWAHFVQHLGNTEEEAFFTREKLIFIVLDAFSRIAANIHQTTRGPRSRQELMTTFKFFLLSNLSLSKLNQDISLMERLNKVQARNP